MNIIESLSIKKVNNFTLFNFLKYEYMLFKFNPRIIMQNNTNFVLYLNSTAIGCVRLTHRAENVTEITNLFITINHRNKGFSKFLLSRVFQESDENVFYIRTNEVEKIKAYSKYNIVFNQDFGDHVLDSLDETTILSPSGKTTILEIDVTNIIDYKELIRKQFEFNDAMVRYNDSLFLKYHGHVVSISVILLQIYWFRKLKIYSKRSMLLSIILAYIFTDLVNGYVHLYMDNNHNYNGYQGSLIAAFHLHHKKPRYKKNNIFRVYYNESGSKIWLLVLLIALRGLPHNHLKNTLILLTIFSSLAEVSHYLCHNSDNIMVKKLQKIRILLDPEIHKLHHTHDNINYTFLNGSTDFIINCIAATFYSGYQHSTDLHSNNYIGQTSNR